jgi:hypothetical protein
MLYACSITSNTPLWKAFPLHNYRDGVLKLARTLQLTAGETEELLLAAHHSPQYLTRGAFFSAVLQKILSSIEASIF